MSRDPDEKIVHRARLLTPPLGFDHIWSRLEGDEPSVRMLRRIFAAVVVGLAELEDERTARRSA